MQELIEGKNGEYVTRDVHRGVFWVFKLPPLETFSLCNKNVILTN